MIFSKIKLPTAAAPRRELWWDTVSCILLSFCAMLLLDPLFRFHLSVFTLFWHAALLCTVLLCVGRRVWIWPALLGGMLTTAVTLLFVSGRLASTWQTLLGFIRWWIALFPTFSHYNTEGYILLVHWLSHIGICMLVCLLVRTLRQVWTPGFLVLVFGVTVLLLDFEVSGWALIAGLLGWLMLLPIPALQGNRCAKVAVALLGAGALLCGTLLSSVSLLPLSSSPITWSGSQFGNGIMGNGGGALLDLGLQQQSGKLGGPISLENDSEVLRVSSEYGASLMRIGIYDVYNGDSWELTASQKTDLTAHTQKKLPGNSVPDDWQKISYQVTLLQEGTVLPYFGAPCSLTFQNDASRSVGFDRDVVFSTDRNGSYSYVMQVAVPRERLQWGCMPSVTDNVWDYLRLPYDLPQIVIDTAKRVTVTEAAMYQRVEALCRYLKTEFTYTLTPSEVPNGEDFVAYFLETKEGYCTYFASAMAVMARTIGVPSRLVYGYGLEKIDEGEYIAYGRNAHAWVECYIGGMWYTFDPTPGTGYQSGVIGEDLPNDPFPTTTTTTTTTTATTTTTTAETQPGETTSATSTTSEPTTTTAAATTHTAETTTTTTAAVGTVGNFPWAWLLGVGGALLVLLLVAWRVLTYTRGYSLDIVRARFDTPQKQMSFYLRDIRRQAKLLGVPLQKEETLSSWKERAEGLSPRFVEAITAAEACFYGEHPATDQAVELFAALRDELEARLRQTIALPRYLWYRFVLL